MIEVRDEETGELWGPTALPIREESGLYVARHGQGYSRFEHVSHGVGLELLQFVPLDDPIKVSRLTIRNDSDRPRRRSVTAYVGGRLGRGGPLWGGVGAGLDPCGALQTTVALGAGERAEVVFFLGQAATREEV